MICYKDMTFCSAESAAVKEIDRLKATLEDIAHGRGMFGVSVQADLTWAMETAGKAVGEPKGAGE